MTRRAHTMRGQLLSGQENAVRDTRQERSWRGFQTFCLVLVVFFGALHLYSMNRIAVQGYAIRTAEKRVAELRQENKRLQIHEAELKSLQRIEEAGRRLNMFESQEISCIEEGSPLASR
jgi:hypothetical protein